MGSFKANIIANGNEEQVRSEFLSQQEGKKISRRKGKSITKINVVITSAIPDPSEDDRWILEGTYDIMDE